jgi:hypothetical protein
MRMIRSSSDRGANGRCGWTGPGDPESTAVISMISNGVSTEQVVVKGPGVFFHLICVCGGRQYENCVLAVAGAAIRGCTVEISAGVEDQRAHGTGAVRAAEEVNLGSFHVPPELGDNSKAVPSFAEHLRRSHPAEFGLSRGSGGALLADNNDTVADSMCQVACETFHLRAQVLPASAIGCRLVVRKRWNTSLESRRPRDVRLMRWPFRRKSPSPINSAIVGDRPSIGC